MTSVVIRKGSVRTAVNLVNTENAIRMRNLIAFHYADGFREGKAAKPIMNLAARIEDVASGLFMGTPREIEEKIVRSL